MFSKPIRKFVLTLWQLSALMLVVGQADAHSLQPFSQKLPAEILLQHADDQLSFQAAGENHGIPSSDRSREHPTGEKESDEESKEKDGSEDDSSAHSTHFYTFSASLTQSISSYYLSVSNRRDAVPLYVLFHCWKSFPG